MNIEDLRLRQSEFEADRKYLNKEHAEADKLRVSFVSKFPIDKIKDLSIEDYIVGKGSRESFCCLLENRLKILGDIHGATSYKFGVYYGKTEKDEKKQYRFTKKFGSSYEEAFENVKRSIESLIKAGVISDSDSIKKNLLSAMFKGKILCTYFPDKYLNIFSDQHLKHFLNRLGIDYSKKDDEFNKREYLLSFKNSDLVMRSWSNYDFFRFLYSKIGRPLQRKDIIPKELESYVEIDFPDVEEVTYKFIEPNLKEVKEDKNNQEVILKKIDFDKENKRNRKIGDQGEIIIMRVEKEYLIQIGRSDLVSRVERKSQRSDSYGYDILSFDENGREKFIEVKSTKKKPLGDCNFLMTANEYRHARNKNNYYVYIVFSVHTKNPEILKLNKLFEFSGNKLRVKTASYKISLNLA